VRLCVCVCVCCGGPVLALRYALETKTPLFANQNRVHLSLHQTRHLLIPVVVRWRPIFIQNLDMLILSEEEERKRKTEEDASSGDKDGGEGMKVEDGLDARFAERFQKRMDTLKRAVRCCRMVRLFSCM
jgi:hypothetical protein